MFMVASSVVTTIMVLNYHHRLVDTHDMPNWVKALFLQWLPWILRMSRYIITSNLETPKNITAICNISDLGKRLPLRQSRFKRR